MEPCPASNNSGIKTPVTLFLITCMLLATLPALSFPKVDKLFSAASPQPYPWQFITGAFAQGWAFLPPLLHLAANLALFFFVGPLTERLLGSARFLFLMLAALLAGGLVRSLPGYGPTGASAFILACGPVLWLHWMAIRNDPVFPTWRKAWLGLLVLGMLVVVPLIYGAWLARQSNASPLAFLQANAVHLTAILVGGLAAGLWHRRLQAQAGAASDRPEALDRAAAIFAGLLPAAMIVLILLGALKKI